jgi:hypothetical protein
MTKKEMFAKIATVNANDAEIVAFCENEIALLNKKSASKTPTKTQKENEILMDVIEKDLREFETPITVTELIAGGEGLEGLTNQKVSAMLRKLVEAKRVVKTIEGRKAKFAVA